jgi:hypothetical protein
MRVRADVRGGRPSAEGLGVLEQRLRPRHTDVVFDLGTNDGSAGELRRSVRRADRLTGDRGLVLATVNGPQARAKNQFLKRYARRHDDVSLVRWAGRGQVGSDGIHSTPGGYQARAGMVARALSAREGAAPVARAAALPGYSPSQEKIIRAIDRVADRVGATRRERLAAYMTGGVETNFSNPGEEASDLDSAGWRQERGHYGPESTRRNPGAAAKRIFEEMRGFRGQKMTPGQLAQAVQRSAFPERYAERRDEALSLLAAMRGGGGGLGGARGGGVSGVAPSVSREPVTPGGSGLAGLLTALSAQSEPVVPSSGGVAVPAFAAAPPMPEAYQAPSSGGGPLPDQAGSALAEALSGLQGAQVAQSTVTPGRVTGARQGGLGGRSRGSAGQPRGLRVRRDQNHGAKGIAEYGTRGIYGSGERTPEQNAAVGGASGSDHLSTNRWASAVDAKYGTGKTIAKRLGIRGWKPGTYDRHTITVDGRRFSVQILEDVEGHYDHTHVGVQRVR